VGKLPLVSRSSLNGVELVVPSALVVSSAVSVNLASFRSQVLHALHQRSVQGTLAPYAAAYDAIELFASAATGANADDDNSIRTYLENASYQGLLGSYSYSSTAHTGLGASQMALVPMSELSNGLFVKAKRAG
jgi:ABC-type branched-subunit amino acid transport system substrate-binding protein